MKNFDQIDKVIMEYREAVVVVNDLPSGDAKADRKRMLLKAQNLILHADNLARLNRPIIEAVESARDAIQLVFLSLNTMDSSKNWKYLNKHK